MTQKLAGGCLCGAVRFEITGTPRQPVACHCAQCRRTSGHYAAFASVPHADFRMTERRGLKWYRSSELAERGFCSECGASLFWQPTGKGRIAVAAGCLDAPTGLAMAGHIFTAFKGDYYPLDDRLPAFPEGDDGSLDLDGTKLA